MLRYKVLLIIFLLLSVAGCSRNRTTHAINVPNQYAPYMKSLLYLNNGKIDLAIKEAIKSAQIARTPDILIYIARLKAYKNKFAAANIAQFVYKRNPLNKKVVDFILSSGLPIGSREKIAIANKFLRHSPDDNAVRIELSKIYISKGMYNKALLTLLKADGANPKIMLQKGIAYLKLGFNRKGKTLLEKVYKLRPANINLGLFLATLNERRGDLKKAIQLYKSVVKYAPAAYSIYYKIAEDLEKIGKNKEALTFYKKVIFNNSRMKNEALLSSGMIYFKMRNFAYSEEYLSNYLKANKSDYGAVYYLALSKIGLGKLKSAYRLLQTINAGTNFYIPAIASMADIYNRLDMHRKSLALIDKALMLKSNNIGLMMLKAHSLTLIKNYKQSLSEYGKILKITRNSENGYNVYVAMADIKLNHTDNLNGAIGDLKKAISIFPNDSEAMNYLGYVYIDKNINISKGIELIKKALKINPANLYFQDSLGWGYYKLHKYKKALFFLKKAGRSGDPTILKHLGIVYERLKEYKLAKSSLTKSFKQKNDNEVYKLLIKLEQPK